MLVLRSDGIGGGPLGGAGGGRCPRRPTKYLELAPSGIFLHTLLLGPFDGHATNELTLASLATYLG